MVLDIRNLNYGELAKQNVYSLVYIIAHTETLEKELVKPSEKEDSEFVLDYKE